jgi:hypothetical protein
MTLSHQMEESEPPTATTELHQDSESETKVLSDFDKIIDKDIKLDKLLLDAVQTIKRMHELKMEIKTKENEFDEDKTRLLKSWYLNLHTQKLSNFSEILKAVEEINR